jgi:serine/threonine protein kinase
MIYEAAAIREHFWVIQLLRLLWLIPPWVLRWQLGRRNISWLERHIDWVGVAAYVPVSWFIVTVSMLHRGYSSPYLFAITLIIAGPLYETLWPLRISTAFYACVHLAYLAPMAILDFPVDDPRIIHAQQGIMLAVFGMSVTGQQLRLRFARVSYNADRNELSQLETELSDSRRPGLLPTRIGRYNLLKRIGIGGMAETFLAVARGPGEFELRVCIKCVLPAHMEETHFVDLFLDEARITASMQHSNIVQVVDFGRDGPTGVLFLALELVEGIDLRQLLRQQPDRRLRPDLVTLIAIELATALEYSHHHAYRVPDQHETTCYGVIHRDISPSNVLISNSGEVKLTDFGVAKELRVVPSTATTSFKGKLMYASPEQLRGRSLDARSDLFSLGVVLYECLVGTRPFDDTSDVDAIQRVLSASYTKLNVCAPENTPVELIDAIESLLIADKESRCASARILVDALQPIAPTATTRRELASLVAELHVPLVDDLALYGEPTAEVPTPIGPSRPPRPPRLPTTRTALPQDASSSPLDSAVLERPKRTP